MTYTTAVFKISIEFHKTLCFEPYHDKSSPDKGLGLVVVSLVNETTVKILKFGTPQTIAIIVLKIEKFDVTLH